MKSVGLSLLLAGAPALAGGFAVSEQSSVVAATGGAGTARADDPAAAWYNPAALTDGRGLRLGGALMLAVPQISASDVGGKWHAETSPDVLSPFSLYLSQSSGDHAYGLSVTVPFGAGITWPGDWAGRYEIVSAKIQVVRMAPFVAWRFGSVSVSAGVQTDFARMQLQRKLDFVDQEGTVALDMSGVGFGGHASLFWNVNEKLELGASYKSRTQVDLSGDASFVAPSAFEQKTMDGGAHSSMTLPDRIAVGARYHARSDIDFLADVETLLWDTNQSLDITFDHMQTPDVHQRNDWHTTVAVRAGAEWRPAPEWALRGGAYIDPSPAPDSTLAPTTPDSTRLGLTLGGGHDFGTFRADFFYSYLSLLDRRTKSPDSVYANYSGSAHMFGLGLSYRN